MSESLASIPDRTSIDVDGPQSRLFDHAHRLLKSHEILLTDSERNRKFYDALRARIKPGSKVLDIGAGTGIWAVAAAKLGAERVVAVERDEMLIGVIKLLTKEHGLDDRVEAVCASSFDLSTELEFDVVVSETIGCVGYDEGIVEIMADSRRRFLRKGGNIIPETISLYAAAARLNTHRDNVPTGMDFDFAALVRMNFNSPTILERRRDAMLLTRPARLISTDLRKADATPSLTNLRAAWDMPGEMRPDCIIVWVESRLATGIRLSTRKTTSWRPTIYRISSPERPFETMEFTLSLTAASNYWSVSFLNGEDRQTRKYSPEYAAIELMTAARGAGVINHEGRIVHKTECNGTIACREIVEDDTAFLYELYRRTRLDEVAEFGWSKVEQESFIAMQFEMQSRAYAIQYPNAVQQIVLCDNLPAGRLIIDRSGMEITLVDISVLPEFRGRGVASHLIAQLQAESKAIILSVDKANVRARRLYEKHGFIVNGESELSFAMAWNAIS